MMKFLREKLSSVSFWVTLSGALTLILSRLGYSDSATLSQNIVDGLASLMLVFGIATLPVRNAVDGESTKEDTDKPASEEKADEAKEESEKKK